MKGSPRDLPSPVARQRHQDDVDIILQLSLSLLRASYLASASAASSLFRVVHASDAGWRAGATLSHNRYDTIILYYGTIYNIWYETHGNELWEFITSRHLEIA